MKGLNGVDTEKLFPLVGDFRTRSQNRKIRARLFRSEIVTLLLDSLLFLCIPLDDLEE